MRNFSLSPATSEIVAEMTGEKSCLTIRAFVVNQGKEKIGIIGLHLYQTHLVLFSYIKPEVQERLKDYRRAVIMAYRYVMEIAKSQKLPVYSKADEDIDGSDRLLTHLGFKPYREGVYEWRGYK